MIVELLDEFRDIEKTRIYSQQNKFKEDINTFFGPFSQRHQVNYKRFYGNPKTGEWIEAKTEESPWWGDATISGEIGLDDKFIDTFIEEVAADGINCSKDDLGWPDLILTIFQNNGGHLNYFFLPEDSSMYALSSSKNALYLQIRETDEELDEIYVRY